MIKLILIAFLSLALSGLAHGHPSDDEYDKDCAFQGSAKIKLIVDVPPGACGCSSSEEDNVDNCLGLENSKKISDAVLNILAINGHSYDVIADLKIQEFLGGSEYNAFAQNIKDNDFSKYEGFDELKEYVETFRPCKKECKVYFTLRKALLENLASAQIEESENEDGSLTLAIGGDIIVLGDIVKEIQEKFAADNRYRNVIFRTKTFLVDVNLLNDVWHGKNIRIETDNFLLLGAATSWDVQAIEGEESNGSVDIVSSAIWHKGAEGTNTFDTYPAYNLV